VYIYGSYRKIKTGLSLFLDHPVFTAPDGGMATGQAELSWVAWLNNGHPSQY